MGGWRLPQISSPLTGGIHSAPSNTALLCEPLPHHGIPAQEGGRNHSSGRGARELGGVDGLGSCNSRLRSSLRATVHPPHCSPMPKYLKATRPCCQKSYRVRMGMVAIRSSLETAAPDLGIPRAFTLVRTGDANASRRPSVPRTLLTPCFYPLPQACV